MSPRTRELLATVPVLPVLSISLLLGLGGCDIEDTRRPTRQAPKTAMAAIGPGEYPEPLPFPPKPATTENLYEHALDVVRWNIIRNPKIPETVFALARTHERFGFDDKAIETYLVGLGLSPNRPDIHLALGFLYSQRDEFTRAYAAYDAALALDPKIGSARTRKGMLYFQEGKLDEAVREYEAEISNDTADSLTYFDLGQALQQKKDFESSVRAFERCLELDQYHQNGLYSIAQVYQRLGKKDKAKHYRERYQEMIKKEREHKAKRDRTPQAIRNDELQKTAETYSSDGDMYIALGKIDQGIQAFQSAVLFDPKDPVAAVRLVDLLRQHRTLPESVEIGLRLARVQPQNLELLFLVGGLCMDSRNYAQGTDLLLKVIERDPDNVVANRTLAFAILRGQVYGEESPSRAFEHSTRAVKKQRSWENLNVHAYVLFSNGRPDEALKALEEAHDKLRKKIENNPTDTNLQNEFDRLSGRLATIRESRS